jgi:hypothetical protein
MKSYLKGIANGFAAVVGVAVLFAAIVMLVSGIKLGFFSPVIYDPRLIAQYYWYLALPLAGVTFALGFWVHRRRAGTRVSKL